MEQSIHAHDVLDILGASEAPLAEAELLGRITARYGQAASFTNCRGDRFTFDELVAFMLERGKVASAGGKLSLNRAEVCGH